jgi:hypothetical protein
MAALVFDYLLMRLVEVIPDGTYPHLRGLHARCGDLPAWRITAPSPDELMPGKPL